MKITKRSRAIIYVLAVLFVLAVAFPLLWMVMSSFKPGSEINTIRLKVLPSHWVTEHYVDLFEDGTFLRSLIYTFLGAAVFAIGGIAVNSMAAYAFARIDFKFKKIVWVYVILTMFVPFMSIFVTSYIVVFRLGMTNNVSVLIVPALATAANVFFFRQFYLFFPKSLEEAAIMDGCTRLGVFLRIFIPNSLSIFVIIGIGRFMGYWNSYIWAVMTIANEKLYTVMQKLSYFRNQYGNNWGPIMAGSVVAAIPPMMLLLIFQRYIIQGVKITGMK